MRQTDEFVTFARQVRDVASPLPSFTGIWIDAAARSLAVYGVDDPESAVSALLDSAPTGVSAHWVSVPYSRDQLNQAKDALFEAITELTSVGTNADYTGLLASVSGSLTPERRTHLEQSAARATPVRVNFIERTVTPAAR